MKTRRCGIMLLEMLAAMFIGSFVIVGLTFTLSKLLAANHSSREHIQSVTNLGRLGEQFRKDAKQATRIELVDAVGPLVFHVSEDAQTSYLITPAGLQRTTEVDHQVVGRELYSLHSFPPKAFIVSPEERTAEIWLHRIPARESLKGNQPVPSNDISRPTATSSSSLPSQKHTGRFAILAACTAWQPAVASEGGAQ